MKKNVSKVRAHDAIVGVLYLISAGGNQALLDGQKK
mgnify:CR=1 FL=1